MMMLKEKLMLMLVGIIFAIIGGAIFHHNNSIGKICTDEVTATISEIHVSHVHNKKKTTVTVTYTYNNENYEKKLNFYDFTMSEGKQLTLFVNPEDPTQIFAGKREYILPIVFIVLGSFTFILGIFRHKFRSPRHYHNFNV